MEPPNEFLSSFKPAIDVFNSHIDQGAVIRILTHNDADGVASGSIISYAIMRAGAPFKTTVEKRLDEQILKGVMEEKPSLIILTDFGSGYLEMVGNTLPDIDTIILDHHMPLGNQPSNVKQVNPILHGIDGPETSLPQGSATYSSRHLTQRTST